MSVGQTHTAEEKNIKALKSQKVGIAKSCYKIRTEKIFKIAKNNL